jgi:transcription-repair coupling factor (superfamily II helicase)
MPTLLHPPLPDAVIRHWRWRGLHGSARALALAEAVAADTRPWVFIAADTRESEQLAAELRFFAGRALEILTLPDWEVLPYDIFSPHPDIVSERLRTLSRLPGLRRGILLLAVDSLLTRLPPVPYVQARSFELRRGEPLAIEPLRLRLAQSGYASVGQVSSPGEFALRGSLFDVFPMGSPAPVRVDLLDDHIDTIRRFDPDSQRSLESVEQLRLLPARELPLDAESVRAFRRRYRARFEGDITRMSVYRGVSEGIAPPGIEFYSAAVFREPRRRSPTTCRPMRSWPAMWVWLRRWIAPGRPSARATRTGATTSSGHCCRRPRPSSNPRDCTRRWNPGPA